jgi:hypothetical protein
MTEATLSEYGLVPVARVRIVDQTFVIEITNQEIAQLPKCIYAFLVGGTIVRIGSSKAILRTRFKSWERDLTNALNGRKSRTADWEAKAWNEELGRHGGGVIFARQGTEVSTRIGKFHAYLDEESTLIGIHLPRLNRSKHR